MKFPIISLAVLGVLCCAAAAQEPPSNPAATSSKLNPQRQAAIAAASEAWQNFQNEFGPAWIARWCEATETPKQIYGPGIDLHAGAIATLADARYHATETLYRFSDLLRIDPSQFVERTAAKSGRVYTLVFDQLHRGIPVLGGRADVRINEIGRVAMFGSTAPRIPADFVTIPAIAIAPARAIAWQSMGLPAPVETMPPLEGRSGASSSGDRLVIWTDLLARKLTSVRLAWEIRISALDQMVQGRAYVDALSGAFIEYVSDIHNIDIRGNVRAWVNTSHGATGPLSNTPMHNIQVSSSVGSAFCDANGDFTIPNSGTTPVNLTVNFGAGRRIGSLTVAQGTRYQATATATPGTPVQIQMLSATASEFDRSQSAAFWSTNAINEYCRGILGSIPSAADRIAVRVNVNASCNAYYTNNSINFYASSSSCNNTGFTSVIFHEWGHGLDDRYGGISQTDGLSEGWGDILATYGTGQPIIGAGFFKSGGSIRTALNNLTYPAGGGVHQEGETWMGFAWDVRTNLIASLGAAAGIARAEEIVIGSLPADATNQPDAVVEVFVQDDDDGNLANGTPNYPALEAAAVRRHLPYPEIQLMQISHTPLQSTTEQLTPRIVRATVTPLQGTISSVLLLYNTGGISHPREMVPSGTANEYIALLPGFLSPQSVNYFIVARHSSGVTKNFPETGFFTYSIGNETQVFFDNFEAATSPWTHAQVATQDDWQRGTPQGKTGTSSGVSWRDPAAAFSGTKCWANDLGNSGWNGAYAARVENWLHSPVLNLSGKTGVKLAFKRWLTVEEGIYDQATISVNGTRVWANPANGHLIDTAWTDFEIPIPQADNNPAVTLEWRLKSDAGLQLGGWNIDDVKVFTFEAIQPPAVQYSAAPAQIGLGASSSLALSGAPNAAALIFFSDSAGPLNLPGLPPLSIGAGHFLLGTVLDGSGALAFSVAVPPDPALTGFLLYSQALQIDTGLQIDASNPMIFLIGS